MRRPGWPAWSLGNHDVPRFPTRLTAAGDPRQGRSLLALLLCLRGGPYLYQGDELGLPQAHVPFERLQDPFAIPAVLPAKPDAAIPADTKPADAKPADTKPADAPPTAPKN